MSLWVLHAVDLEGRNEVHRVSAPMIDVGDGAVVGLRLTGRWVDVVHCVFEAAGGELWVEDRGSRTGTFVNNAPITGKTRVRPGDRVAVGEWTITASLTEITSSHGPARGRRGGVAIGVGIVSVLSVMSLGTVMIECGRSPPSSADRVRAVRATQALLDLRLRPLVTRVDARPPSALRSNPGAIQVEHEVLPGETMATIAARYRISADLLARSNGLVAASTLHSGRRLVVDAVNPPLPRQHYLYQVQSGDRWQDLHARFGLGRQEIEAQNGGLASLTRGETLHLWVEPQIQRRRPASPPPPLPVQGSAVSLGAPNQGSVEGRLALPESSLYLRRSAVNAFGSSSAIAALQEGIAHFRQSYAYEGVLVVSDLGKEGGGPLSPHKSHQSGRDVDIWLPTLRGAYHEGDIREFMKTNRKPHPDDVNWLAAWGLVESLLATDKVQLIFLNWKYQDRLYAAARSMGVSDRELAWIQRQPGDTRPNSGSPAPLRHADSHNGHIHVRFRCGPEEHRCSDAVIHDDEP